MSLHAIVWSFDQDVPSTTDKLVLLAMANFTGDSGLSYPTLDSICRITSIKKEETVSNSQKSLVQSGFISDTGNRCGQTGQVKVFQFPPDACRRVKNQSPRLTEPLSPSKPPQSPLKAPSKPPQSPRLAELPYIRNSEQEQKQKQEVINEAFNYIQTELNKIFRKDGRGWSNLEERLLLDIVRLGNSKNQLVAILNLRKNLPEKDLKFFPKKLQRLLEDWNGLLDQAVVEKESKGRQPCF